MLKVPIAAQAKKLAWHPTLDILAFGGDKVTVQDDRGRYADAPRSEVPVTVVSLKQS